MKDSVDPEIPVVNPEFNDHAVRIYGQNDTLEDFPVLKAFQQYVDAEQSKARRRMLMLSVFFVALMMVVITVFVFLLIRVGAQNQRLNDRLVEYVINERNRGDSKQTVPVVVQPQQDGAAILALTSKIDDLQKKLAADQAKAEREVKEAKERAEKAIAEATKGPSAEELEITRLKALLASEKKRSDERAAYERQRQREQELEAYRRKHYPEYYKTDDLVEDDGEKTFRRQPSKHEDVLDDLDDLLKDMKPRTYFDDDETNGSEPTPARVSPRPKPAQKQLQSPSQAAADINIDLKSGKRLTLDFPEE